MNEFTARINLLNTEVNIRCATLAALSELVAHVQLFKPGAVAAAHRGLGNVIRPEDNPEAGVSADEKAAVCAPIEGTYSTDAHSERVASEHAARAQVLDPAVVFGGAGVPLPPAPAPSTADVAASSTAPATSMPTAPESTAPAPMPAPPADAPEASAAPTSPVVRDADGVPWDHRIHSETKGIIADGTWRKRRNLPNAKHARITAELKALAGIQAPAPTSAPSVPRPPAASISAAHTETAPTESPYAAFMGYLNTVMTGASIKLTINELAAQIAQTGELFGLETKLTLQSLKHADPMVQAAARQAVEAYVAGKA